jgi:hypothetical protein
MPRCSMACMSLSALTCHFEALEILLPLSVFLASSFPPTCNSQLLLCALNISMGPGALELAPATSSWDRVCTQGAGAGCNKPHAKG